MPRKRPRVRGERPNRASPLPAAQVGRVPGERPRGLGLQLAGCAALCAAGATMGGLRVLDELTWHLPSARAALTAVALTGAAGVLLGFWLPRQALRRWRAGGAAVAGRRRGRRPEPRGPVELEFAASVVGSLAVAVAVLWILLCLGATFAEEWRAWLTSRFLFAPALKRALVLGPAAVLGVVLALVSTLLLVGLHGWRRLVTAGDSGGAGFWGALPVGAAAGGFIAASAPPTPVLDVMTVVLTLGAGVVAVGRRLQGLGTPESKVERRPQPLSLVAALAAPVVAAGGLGVLLSDAWPVETTGVGPIGTRLGWLAVGNLAGITLCRWQRVRGAAPWVPVGAAVVFAASGWSRGSAADVVQWIAWGAALAAVWQRAAKRTLSEVGRSQAALAVVATATVLGAVLGLVAAAQGPTRAGAVAGALLLGAAWLHARADRDRRPARRRLRAAAAVGTVGLLMPGLVGLRAVRGESCARPPEVLGRLAAAVRSDRTALLLTSAETLWDADLNGPRADVVIADVSWISASPRGTVARLTRRLQTAVRPGGTFVLVGRSAELLGLSVAAGWESPCTRTQVYGTAEGEYVLVAGGLLPARLAEVLDAESK